MQYVLELPIVPPDLCGQAAAVLASHPDRLDWRSYVFAGPWYTSLVEILEDSERRMLERTTELRRRRLCRTPASYPTPAFQAWMHYVLFTELLTAGVIDEYPIVAPRPDDLYFRLRYFPKYITGEA